VISSIMGVLSAITRAGAGGRGGDLSENAAVGAEPGPGFPTPARRTRRRMNFPRPTATPGH